MLRDVLSLLCDPNTGEDLVLDVLIEDEYGILEGSLRSPSNSFSITNGIVRFVEDQGDYESFGFQWNRWAKVQFEGFNVGRPMQGHTARMFKSITQFNDEEMEGRLVLDVGCGPGRFSDVCLNSGAKVISLDYSSAIDIAKGNFSNKNNILFLQADALNLPIKDNSVDLAFSIGVLHHTPEPERGVSQAFRVLKKGGVFAVAVYEKGGYYDFWIVQFWRRLFKLLWPFFGAIPPLIYTYFIVYTLGTLAEFSKVMVRPFKLIFPFVFLPDKNWALLDTFDSITPSYQSAHTLDEVRKWFEGNNYIDIKQTGWGGSCRGKK